MSQSSLRTEQVITKAMKNEAFRQKLLSNPKEVLEREMGITLPRGVTVHVYEDTPTTIHLVLPSAPSKGGVELSDAELEKVAGGVGSENQNTCAECFRD